MARGESAWYSVESLRGHAAVLRSIADRLEQTAEQLKGRGVERLLVENQKTLSLGLEYVGNFSLNVQGAYDRTLLESAEPAEGAPKKKTKKAAT